jgi:hypothetical protein
MAIASSSATNAVYVTGLCSVTPNPQSTAIRAMDERRGRSGKDAGERHPHAIAQHQREYRAWIRPQAFRIPISRPRASVRIERT